MLIIVIAKDMLDLAVSKTLVLKCFVQLSTLHTMYLTFNINTAGWVAGLIKTKTKLSPQ